MANSLKLPVFSLINLTDRILQIVECNRIAICLYSMATNPNTDKSIDIQIRLYIKEY